MGQPAVVPPGRSRERSATATLLWLLLLLAPPLAAAQPKLVMPGGFAVEFGDVYGSETTRLLPILNGGTDTLRLGSVSASCGCTAALVSRNRLAPGDTGYLSITFDARRFQGKVHKTVSMETNDSSHRHVSISFGVNVIKTLMFDPEYLYFTVDVDTPATKTLTVANASGAPIRILSVTSTTGAIALKTDATVIPPSGQATITATFTAPSPGTHRGDIDVLTDLAPNPHFKLRCFALAKRSR